MCLNRLGFSTLPQFREVKLVNNAKQVTIFVSSDENKPESTDSRVRNVRYGLYCGVSKTCLPELRESRNYVGLDIPMMPARNGEASPTSSRWLIPTIAISPLPGTSPGLTRALISPPSPPPVSTPISSVAALRSVPGASPPPRPLFRAIPIIAFTADGCSQVVDPDKGIPALTPDSPQWFAWLASTTILTFQGRHGSFTATRRFRRGKRVQIWNVSRCLHGRSCTLSAGMTMTVTAARLEGLARQLLTRFAPL